MKKIISFALTLAILVSVLAVMPVFATENELVGTDVTLTEGISLNFYIKADTNQTVTNATPVTKNGVDCYKLTVDLGAKNMGDVLTAQLKNGNISVGEAFTSSVKGYADAILASTYDKATVALVNAMLGYGAAAQNYFGYKTDALVGTPVTNTAALNATTAPDAVISDTEGIYLGASLVLQGEMLLRFYFAGNDLNVTMNGKALSTANKGGYCYADVAVMPYEIGSSVTVSCGDTTVTYSPLNYLKSKASDPKLSEMVASIYAYGVAAEEYRESAAVEPDDADRVLLVSIDGLRPDAIAQTKYFEMLKAMGAYTLTAQTVYPSFTLPCHMSMFHSVTPETHGIEDNTYNLNSPSAGNGITEALAAQGLTSAMFFDWQKLENLSQAAGVKKTYIDPETRYTSSVPKLSSAVIDHVQNSPTDFTFLYFGHTDWAGEQTDGGWMESDYMTAVNFVFGYLMEVIKSLPEGYTVIITADHGGGGDNGNNAHGSDALQDMLIPMFIIGDGFEAGASLGNDVSILDVAPTVVNLLGVGANSDWEGRILTSVGEAPSEDAVLDLFLSSDSWSNYNYGTIKGTTATSDSVTVEVQGSGVTGMQLNKAAITEMLRLGYSYLSFNVNLESVSGGKTPGYVDVYSFYHHEGEKYEFLLSSPDYIPDPGEFYYANGRNIEIDLWKLYHRLTDESGYGLMFILCEINEWSATNGGKITFSNIEFTRSYNESNTSAEEKALDLFLSKDAWSAYKGTISSTSATDSDITARLSYDNSGMSGLQLNKAAIGEMISLGFRYLTFTVTYEGVSGGVTPTYADVYTYKYNADLNFHVSTPDSESPYDPGECYYASGREITVDLWVLYQRLTTDHGLIFVLSAGLYWQATYGGYITFSNVKLEAELEKREPTAEEKEALEVFFDSNTWEQYTAHGKVNSVANDGDTLTISVTNNPNKSNFAGMQLSKAAVGEMIDLGFRYLSFTMNYEAGASGINPGYACVYCIKGDNQIDLDFLGKSGIDYYYRDGEQITIDLEGLYDVLLDGYVFVFILTTRADWVKDGSDATTTKDGYFIFSNIEFS